MVRDSRGGLGSNCKSKWENMGNSDGFGGEQKLGRIRTWSKRR